MEDLTKGRFEIGTEEGLTVEIYSARYIGTCGSCSSPMSHQFESNHYVYLPTVGMPYGAKIPCDKCGHVNTVTVRLDVKLVVVPTMADVDVDLENAINVLRAARSDVRAQLINEILEKGVDRTAEIMHNMETRGRPR